MLTFAALLLLGWSLGATDVAFASSNLVFSTNEQVTVGSRRQLRAGTVASNNVSGVIRAVGDKFVDSRCISFVPIGWNA